MLQGRSLDVVEMDAASHTGVENVRENIIENVRFAPVLRAYKVFIIDEVHMLSTSAFNALLKTIEEPPAHALFILATTEIHKVPETIISRTQRFDFRRIGTCELVARLERLVKTEGGDVEGAVLEEIARHSEGSQRDAESLLAQILSLGEKKITMEIASLVLPVSPHEEIISLAELLSRHDAAPALATVDRLIEEGIDLERFVHDMIRYARALLLACISGLQGTLSDLPERVRDRSVSLAQAFEPRDLTRLMDLLLEASSARMTIPQLPLEIAIVKFCTSELKPKADSDVFPQNNNIGTSGSHGAIGDEIPTRRLSEFVPDRRQTLETGEPVPTRGTRFGETSESPSATHSELRPQNSELEPASKDELAKVVMNAEIALPEEVDGHVTFKTVEGKWNEVFEKVAQAHTSLGFLLKTARLIGVKGNEVRLGFDFPFHADTMNAAKNRDRLEMVMQKVFGARVRVLSEYVHADADEIVGEVVGELGGRMVE